MVFKQLNILPNHYLIPINFLLQFCDKIHIEIGLNFVITSSFVFKKQ